MAHATQARAVWHLDVDCLTYVLARVTCALDIARCRSVNRQFRAAARRADALRETLSFARAGARGQRRREESGKREPVRAPPSLGVPVGPAPVRGMHPPPKMCGDFMLPQLTTAEHATGDDAMLAAWLPTHSALKHLDLWGVRVTHVGLWIVRAHLHATLESLCLWGCTRLCDDEASVGALCCGNDVDDMLCWMDSVTLMHVRSLVRSSGYAGVWPPAPLSLTSLDLRGLGLPQALLWKGIVARYDNTLENIALTLRVGAVSASLRWDGVPAPESAGGDTGDVRPLQLAVESRLPHLAVLHLSSERGVDADPAVVASRQRRTGSAALSVRVNGALR